MAEEARKKSELEKKGLIRNNFLFLISYLVALDQQSKKGCDSIHFVLIQFKCLVAEPISIEMELLLELPGDEDTIEANLYSVYEEIKFEVKPKKKRPRRKHSVEDFSDVGGSLF